MREMNESAPASEYRSRRGRRRRGCGRGTFSAVRYMSSIRAGQFRLIGAAAVQPSSLPVPSSSPFPPPHSARPADEELSARGQTDFGQPHPSINPIFYTGYRSPLAHWGVLHTCIRALLDLLSPRATASR